MIGSVAVVLVFAAAGCRAQSPSITFSQPPSIPEPVSAARDTSHGLGGFYAMASGLVDTIRPGNLPHDTVGDLAATVSDQLQLDWGIPPPDKDVRSLVKEFLQWLAPVLAFMLLGAVLAVATPVAGCCTACCRCRGRCGAQSRIYRKKNQNVKCTVFLGIFLVTTAMIFVGATISAVSVRHVTESLSRLESTVDTALHDVDNYLDAGSKQVFFIANDQFDIFKVHVLNDMEHIGEWFETDVGDDFQSHALSVVNHASSFLETLTAIDDLLTGGNSLIAELRNTTHELMAQVSRLNSDLESLRNSCIAHGLDSQCQFISSTEFSVTVDFDEINAIEFNDEVNFTSIEEQIATATETFRDMAKFIDTEAQEYGLSKRAESEFYDAHSTLEYDFLNALNETVENMISEGGHIDRARDEVHNALKYLDRYKALWDALGLLLVSIFFLVVSLFLTGAFCGSFGYSRVVQPHSRSGVSHCGGRCIIAGVVVAFVASPVMFMAASATLGLATGVQKLCEDLEPPDYPVIRGVADNPSVWGSGLTLVGLVTREETDAAVNLSIYHSLSGCADNEPLWKALDGDRLYSYEEFDDAFNCTSFGVGTEDFQPFDSFNGDDIFPYLTDVNQSFNEVDFQEFEESINETEFLSFDLAELEANLTAIINNASVNTTVHNHATQIRGDLEDIETTVQNLRSLQRNTEANITELQDEIIESESELTAFSDALEDLLAELHDVVGQATDDYVQRLCSFVDEYINYANDTIRNEVGRCAVFPAAYSAVYSTVCGNAVDGLNGYWLGVGWCMVFTLLAVVVGIVLSDYFRRAGTRVVQFSDTSSLSNSLEEEDDDDVTLIRMRPSGKSNGKIPPEEQHLLNTTEMDMEW